MVPRKGGTPLRTVTPSLEASDRSQIDDLVQRNRTLEHTVKKLSDGLASEVARSKTAVADIQKQWQMEQLEWREGCDVLQSCHKIVQLRNATELEKQRMRVLKEVDVCRQEQVKRLQRDFRITMFQVKEAELEGRIAEIEDNRQLLILEHEENTKTYKGLLSEKAAQLQQQNGELARVEQEKRDLEEKLARQQEEYARFQATTESSASKLERTTLKLEGAQTKITDLERTNDELKRTNTDIQRQLEKWQKLETKGDAEVESLRKRRIELEVQVKELEQRLESTVEEDTRALEKEKHRVEKLKLGIHEWQAEAKNFQQSSEDAAKQLTKVKKQLETLKAERDVERARVGPPSPDKEQLSVHEAQQDEALDGVESAQDSPPPLAKTKPSSTQTKSKPASRKRKPPDTDNQAGPSGTTSESTEEQRTTNNKAKGKGKRTRADSDIEEVIPQPRTSHKRLNKNDAGRLDDKKKVKAKVVEEDHSAEVVLVQPEEQPVKTRNKRKASSKDADAPSDELAPRTTKGGRANGKSSSTKTTKSKQAKPSETVQSKAAEEEEPSEPETEAAPPKRQKRKINLFPATNSNTDATFNFLSQGDGGLNIPTMLSPVKESEAVPSRSTTGSVMGIVGSMLKNSFIRR